MCLGSPIVPTVVQSGIQYPYQIETFESFVTWNSEFIPNTGFLSHKESSNTVFYSGILNTLSAFRYFMDKDHSIHVESWSIGRLGRHYMIEIPIVSIFLDIYLLIIDSE